MMQATTRQLDAYLRVLTARAMEVPQLGIEEGIGGIIYAAYLLGIEHDMDALHLGARELALRTIDYANDEHAYRLRYNEGTYSAHILQSVIHGPIGYWMAVCLVTEAGSPLRDLAVRTYFEWCLNKFTLHEFAFGGAGALWSIARVFGALDARDAEVARKIGCGLLADVWQRYLHSVREGLSDAEILGFAHGRVGVLYAVLAFCRSAQHPLPEGIEEALNSLACMVNITQRGAFWPPEYPLRTREDDTWPGFRESWCNGVSGFIPLWCMAFDMLRTPLYAALAEKAGVWLARAESRHSASLCCGVAGHIVAFRWLQRLQAAGPWQGFAEQLISACRIDEQQLTYDNHSLLKGLAGVVLAGCNWL